MATPQLSQALIWEQIPLTLNNTKMSISTVRRDSPSPPIIFLHGFGGTKEDFSDINLHPSLSHRAFIAYDAPGSGSSTVSDFSALSMPFLVSVAEAVLKFLGVGRFHLVGHSMGGLAALLLAQRNPGAVLSFVDIKGNLAPEDCFLSRQILDFPSDDPEAFFSDFVERTRRAAFFGSGAYAAGLRAKVRAEAARPIFESMVEISDHEDLLGAFEGLACPKMFMFGEQHASLSYLPRIAAAGVELAEIPRSGHFVMYTNPVAMWERIADFVERAS
ncbi:alpha beta hydrolase protein [Colletotrichum musicola]|uniref:Alpha beta hydrolase protein n=1 Tax=Colletotrichum musicola TaxID=2175873 RepID=A0A8H6N2L4_9PEZI|nr:alpha beta hydrolase protein [Colletotrichum musicola]